MDRDGLLSRSSVFCILPWTHLHVWPGGETFPCCVAAGDHPLGNTHRSSLSEIWNGDAMRTLRRNMLDGSPSAECSRCYELERMGVVSLRLDKRREFAHHWPVVESTQPDGAVARLNLPYLDIRFSNLCNLRCRSCSLEFSSAWFSETPGTSLPRVIRPTDDPEELWRQLEPLLPRLEEIYFAGGEPLLMEEHYRVLRILSERKLFQVRLRYNTNFSQLVYHQQDAVERWNQFESVSIGASLDGMEARGEYLRKGQLWSDVVANRKRLLREAPRVQFQLTPTLSAMNVLHLPDFHRAWIEAGLVEPSSIYVNLLTQPLHLRIQVLPPRLKDQVRERYRQHIDYLAGFGDHTQLTRPQFQAALRFLDEEDRTSELGELRRSTQRLDELRGERFEQVFPEMRQLLEGAEH